MNKFASEAKQILSLYLTQCDSSINERQIMKVLGKEVRLSRIQKMMTQTDLAIAVDISEAQIVAMEYGLLLDQDVNASMLQEIGRVLKNDFLKQLAPTNPTG